MHDVPPAQLEIVKGAVDLLVLQTLAWGPSHGFAVSKWVAAQTGGALVVEDAALYQALHRLERKEMVEAEWGISDTGRRVRLYTLTKAGLAYLSSQRTYWRRFTAAITGLLDAVPA
jgi:transcriptional regulator